MDAGNCRDDSRAVLLALGSVYERPLSIGSASLQDRRTPRWQRRPWVRDPDGPSPERRPAIRQAAGRYPGGRRGPHDGDEKGSQRGRFAAHAVTDDDARLRRIGSKRTSRRPQGHKVWCRFVSMDVLWIFLLVLLPGFCAMAACRSAGVVVSLPTAFALTLALGYTAAGATAFVLALAGLLSEWSFLLGLGLVSLALLAVARYRPSSRTWRTAIWAARLRPGCVGVGVFALLVVGVSAVRVDPGVNLQFAGRWRYWADGREIAVLGRIPETTTQWATQHQTAVSKIFLNCFTAGFSSVVGANAISAFGALYVLGMLGTAIALWAVAWEMGLRVTSALVPLLCASPLHLAGLSLSLRFADNSGLYKAEEIGRMVAFTALAAAIRGLRTQAWRPLALSAVLFAAAALTHGVATAAALLLGCAYAIAWAVVTGRWRAVARSVLTVSVPASLLIALILLAAGGTVGFGGANSSYVAFDGFDPTALFAGKLRPLRDGSFYLSPWQLLQRFAEAASGWVPSAFGLIIVMVAMAGLAVLGQRTLRHRIAPLPAAACLFIALTVVAALAFSNHSNSYIPATFGQRRLYDYASLGVLLVVLPWAEWGLSLASRAFPRRAVALGAALSVLIVSWVGYRLQPPQPGQRASQLAHAMNAVRTHVPCGERILANRRSNATFEALVGRESVLEGMAPYLRPTELTRVLTLIHNAKPALMGASGGRGFLVREHVGYVVIFRQSGLVASSEVNSGALTREGLQQVYRDSNVAIYRVSGVAATTPRPPAGYDCDVPSITA